MLGQRLVLTAVSRALACSSMHGVQGAGAAFSGLARGLAVESQSSHNHSSSASWQRWGALSFAVAGVALAAGSPQNAALAELASPAPVVSDPYQRPTTLTGIPRHVTLYQYEVCPFCCKLKAVLDYYKVPYSVVEVNPLTKSELKWSSYKKVPVIKLEDGDVVADSSIIISRIAAEVEASKASSVSQSSSSSKGWGVRGSKSSSSNTSSAQAAAVSKEAVLEEEAKWRRWVDERFVKVITANIYRSWDESFNTFRYITEQTNWSWGTREAARLSGALLMWQVGKRMPAKYGIEGDLREALYSDCNKLVDALPPGQPFLGGAEPNLADLSAYGVLKAVWHTPTFEDAMQFSKIAAWYQRVEAAIGQSARVEA
ncbi:glutathione S-transferase [Haematococcus lacustris]